MKYGVYCIRDRKSGWLSPTVDVNDQVAVRNFAYAVQHNAMFSDFASDYSLYKIGEFDTESGDITSILLEFLCDAVKAGGKPASLNDNEVLYE